MAIHICPIFDSFSFLLLCASGYHVYCHINFGLLISIPWFVLASITKVLSSAFHPPNMVCMQNYFNGGLGCLSCKLLNICIHHAYNNSEH